MLVWENILLAINGLRANKTRAMLTMLGIIIGISSVITIMTIGESLKKGINSNMGGVGANNINLMLTKREKMEQETDENGLVFSDETKFESIQNPSEEDLISDEMIEGLRNKFADTIKYVELSGDIGDGRAESGRSNSSVSVKYVNNDYLKGEKVEIKAGRLLSSREQERGKKTCLVSEKVVKDIFHDNMEEALGQPIEIHMKNKYYSYIIVGIYKQNANDLSFLMNQGTTVYIPLSTGFVQTHGNGKFSSITVVGKEGIAVSSEMAKMQDYLNDTY